LINKLVVENLKHRPVRTALSILAVGLEVTMMLTLVGVSRGMLQDSVRRARGVGADIWVRPGESSVLSFNTGSIPEKMTAFLEQQPHVELATGNLIAAIGGIDSVTGVDLEQFTELSGGFKYLSGGPFRKPDDLIVDDYYARQKKLKVGTTVRLLNRDWRVCGIVEPGKLARLIIPLQTLQKLTSNVGKLSQIFVKLDDSENLPTVMASLKQTLPGYKIYSIEEFTSLFSASNVPGLQAFTGVVITLSIVVGFLVVFLSMYTAVLERTREIGILKALGASAAYVLNIILRETTVLALIGSALGIGFSYLTRWLIQVLVPASIIQVIVPGWWPIASAIALGGAWLGAAYPGWRAARQDPIEALSYE
jgi:putative ABC transport system permease protein